MNPFVLESDALDIKYSSYMYYSSESYANPHFIHKCSIPGDKA